MGFVTRGEMDNSLAGGDTPLMFRNHFRPNCPGLRPAFKQALTFWNELDERTKKI